MPLTDEEYQLRLARRQSRLDAALAHYGAAQDRDFLGYAHEQVTQAERDVEALVDRHLRAQEPPRYPVFGARPIIYGVKAHYAYAGYGWSSGWGAVTGEEWNQNLVASVAGIPEDHDGATFSAAYLAFADWPQLEPAAPAAAFTPYNANYTNVYQTSGEYNYSPKPFAITALRNETDTDKMIPVDAFCSSYSSGSTSPCSIAAFVANQPNADRGAIESATFQPLASRTSSGVYFLSGTFVLPADTSAIAIVIASDRYNGSYGHAYDYHRVLSISPVDQMFPPGVVADETILANILLRQSARFIDLWSDAPAGREG